MANKREKRREYNDEIYNNPQTGKLQRDPRTIKKASKKYNVKPYTRAFSVVSSTRAQFAQLQKFGENFRLFQFTILVDLLYISFINLYHY